MQGIWRRSIRGRWNGEPFKGAQGWIYARSSVIIEIQTSCADIVGYGECLCHGYQPPQIAAAFIEHCFRHIVINRDIFDVEVMWEQMYNYTRPYGQYGAALNAISGVDIAIWDAIGKYLYQPVCNLMGGKFREKILAYATGFYRKANETFPDDAIAEAHGYLEKGFRGMKLKIGMGVESDITFVKTIRSSVGPDILLGADANCAYNFANALRLIDGLKDQNIFFYEELLAPEDMDGYCKLRNITPSFITSGENMFGKIGMSRWITSGALDIYQPDVGHAGGFTEMKKIAALIQSHHAILMPHVWGSGVLLAASLQFEATLPAVPMTSNPWEIMIESDQSAHPFKFELINHGIEMHNGYIHVPLRPGIGVDVNRDVLKRFSI